MSSTTMIDTHRNRHQAMQNQQFYSSVISLVNVGLVGGIGCVCFIIPRKCFSFPTTSAPSPASQALGLHFHENFHGYHDNGNDEFVLIRWITTYVISVAGAFQIAWSLCLFLTLYPSLSERYLPTKPDRSALKGIAVQVATGLLLLISGLWVTFTGKIDHEDINYFLSYMQGQPSRRRHLITTLDDMRALSMIYGFVVFFVGCLAFLTHFWPTSSVAVHTRLSLPSPSSSHVTDLVEPLLPQQEEDGNATNSAVSMDIHVDIEQQSGPIGDGQPLQQNDNNDDDNNTGDNDHDNNHDSTGVSDVPRRPTSRIKGTQRLFQLAAPQLTYLYIGCVVLLIRLPFSLSIPHFISTTIGALSQSQFDRARREILYLFLLGTVDALLDFGCIFFFGVANLRILRGVRIDTFAAILRQEISFFDIHTTGELTSRLTADCGELSGDLTWFFRFSIESVVRITGITAYMLFRSPKLGAVALSIVPVIAAVNKVYGEWLSDNARKVQDALASANSVSQESLSCIRTVIAFASENLELAKYVEKINEQFRLNVKQTYMTGIYYMFISTFLINTVVQGTLLMIGSYMIQRGNLTSEVLLAFMLYQGQLQNEMMNLFNSYSSLLKSTGAGDKVFELLDRKPSPPATGSSRVLADADGEGERGDETNRNDIHHLENLNDSVTPMSVEFKNVHFFYPSRGPDNMILNGLDLVIPKGSTVAIVGPSGAGKTTLISLCERFYDPVSGCIFIDGKDIRSLDVKRHRRRVGVVTQEPTLFSGTILDNIMYGSTDAASTDKAIKAAKSANADGFIRSFPNGYNTEVGERGVCLSGGQKQRIAISRAIRKEPSLLLLDEATSALDPDSENIVQKSIDDLLRKSNGITTIIIAHRLQTVRNADMIAVMKDGRIVEQGPHDELMSISGGYYAGMVAKSIGDKLPE